MAEASRVGGAAKLSDADDKHASKGGGSPRRRWGQGKGQAVGGGSYPPFGCLLRGYI